jgi:hypothetical protein
MLQSAVEISTIKKYDIHKHTNWDWQPYYLLLFS